MVALSVALAVPAGADPVLDGIRDLSYGSPIATDASGDLASPGPADWTGTQWTDQTAIYAFHSATTLHLYVDLSAYNNTVSSGSIGLTIDKNNTAAGGTTDPWGNAITFAHAYLPDFLIRGNIIGAGGSDDGWTELRVWDGSDWDSGAGTDWGGLFGVGQIGTKMAYANGQGLEFAIPLIDLGLVGGGTINIEFWGTQTGASKGAYDTVPSDDQTSGWDDATIQSSSVSYAIPEPTTTLFMALGGAALAILGAIKRSR